MKNKIQQIIKESFNSRVEKSNYRNFFSIEVFINNPLPSNIDLDYVFSFINKRIPPFVLDLVDSIHIGHFEDFENRHINAKYSNGQIFLTNDQDNNDDMIDDIVHELAHALEDSYGKEVYLDKSIEQEFLGKRKKLERFLRYMEYDTHLHDFEKIQYDKKLDFFLLKDIGYDTIEALTMGLFINPYAATSIREYFAEGFEDYYLNNADHVRNICPALFKVLDQINNIEWKNEIWNFRTK